MMSILIDTNILVYSANAAADQHAVAKKFVESLRAGQGFCLTWSIVYELIRVMTHPKVFPKPLSPSEARSFVKSMLSSSKVEVLVETPHHLRFLEMVLDGLPPIRGNLYHDVHIAAVMLENGVNRIASSDRHFRLFPSLKVTDPLVG